MMYLQAINKFKSEGLLLLLNLTSQAHKRKFSGKEKSVSLSLGRGFKH